MSKFNLSICNVIIKSVEVKIIAKYLYDFFTVNLLGPYKSFQKIFSSNKKQQQQQQQP